jgi:hypothetical protein
MEYPAKNEIGTPAFRQKAKYDLRLSLPTELKSGKGFFGTLFFAFLNERQAHGQPELARN